MVAVHSLRATRRWNAPVRARLSRADIFTDGSCLCPAQPDLSLGSWAVVCAQQDKWIARGTLAGVRQSVDRAELAALRCALDATLGYAGELTFWIDSSFVAEGFHRILLCIDDVPKDHGDGSWIEIQNLVKMHVGKLQIQHISSHRTCWQEEHPVDEWTAYWNDRVDREAVRAHVLRGRDFMALRDELCEGVHRTCRQLEALQALHLDISKTRLQQETIEDEGEDAAATMRDWWDARRLHADGSWFHDLEEHWLVRLPESPLAVTFGMRFSRLMICWLQMNSDALIRCSWHQIG